MPKLKVTSVALSTLSPHPENPRQGDVGAIVESLKEHGQYAPIVVQQSTNYVIAGNHRLLAARELGWLTIEAVTVDVDDDEALRILLVDNRSSDLATNDDVALSSILTKLTASDKALAGTGYDGDDLDDLLASLKEAPTMLGDPDEVPEVETPVTVLGDVWLLGQHRVKCGDATSTDDVTALMDGKKADMVFTDPPYGVSYVGKTKKSLTIKNDDEGGLSKMLLAAFQCAISACVEGGGFYSAAPAGPQSLQVAQTLDSLGMFRQRLVWVKNAMVMGHSDYHYKHEDIYFGYTPCSGRRGRGSAGWHGDNSQTTVLEFDKPSASKEHPTMKPVELIKVFINNSSERAAIVLDLFGGSGSTLIAAHQSNRTCYMMELDPHYVDVICARFERVTGIVPILERTGVAHSFVA